MILVDTSIWVDHLRAGDSRLSHFLDRGAVLGHPWVTGELSLGSLRQRTVVLGLLTSLPTAIVVTPHELLSFIDSKELTTRGIGYVDAQLLASTQVTTDATLWTRDKRLAAAASQLGLAVDPAVLDRA